MRRMCCTSERALVPLIFKTLSSEVPPLPLPPASSPSSCLLSLFLLPPPASSPSSSCLLSLFLLPPLPLPPSSSCLLSLFLLPPLPLPPSSSCLLSLFLLPPLPQLTASSPSVDCLDSSYLLATCYFRSGRVQQARHALGQHRGDPRCGLLYARCCLQLNE